jgi:hypothetical protein
MLCATALLPLPITRVPFHLSPPLKSCPDLVGESDVGLNQIIAIWKPLLGPLRDFRDAQLVLHACDIPLSGETHSIALESPPAPGSPGGTQEVLLETRVDFRSRMPSAGCRGLPANRVHVVLMVPSRPQAGPPRGLGPHPLHPLLLGMLPPPPAVPFMGHLCSLREKSAEGLAPPHPTARPVVTRAGAFCLDWPAMLRARNPGPWVLVPQGTKGSAAAQPRENHDLRSPAPRYEESMDRTRGPLVEPQVVRSPGDRSVCHPSPCSSPGSVVPNSPEDSAVPCEVSSRGQSGLAGAPPDPQGTACRTLAAKFCGTQEPRRDPDSRHPPAQPPCRMDTGPQAFKNSPPYRYRDEPLPRYNTCGTPTVDGPDGTERDGALGAKPAFPQSAWWLVDAGKIEPDGAHLLAQDLAEALGTPCHWDPPGMPATFSI